MIVKLFYDLMIPMVVQAGFYFPAQDISYQNQFLGAVHWSALGVNDDSGTSDNTSALNALPTNTPIIADCPHSGFVQFTGTWNWPSGLTVWQQPGCVLESTITTPGVYPIQNAGGFTSATPITNVQYYGMQFSFVTPTSTVRVMLAWIDHLKFKYFDINGSGGFAFLRGSDQEVAFGTMENTQTAAGNPGIRHFGNVPKVAASPGMRANDWFHNLNFQTGDAAFQTCQPSSNPLTWGFNTSTDDLLYENSYGVSSSSAVILINEPASDLDPSHTYTYTCTNITYTNVSGIGHFGAIIGDSNNLTQNVTINGGTIQTIGGNGGGPTQPVIGIGQFLYGGSQASNPNTKDITLNNVGVSQFFQTAIGVSGASNVTLINPTTSSPLVGVTSTAATVEILGGAVNTTITGGNIATGNNAQGIVDGLGTAATGSQITGVSVTGVTNAKTGILLQNSVGASVTSSVVSPKSGSTTATGIALTANPSGTHGATVTGNNVSAMPVPIVCASGQGNNVTNNTGAADCAP